MLVKQFNYISKAESLEMLDKITNQKYKVLVLLMLDCGLRVTEACSVKFKNFDFKDRTITIESLKKRGKNDLRTIPISDRLYREIGTYINTSKLIFEKDSYLFPSRVGGHLGRKAVWRYLNTLKGKCTIEHLHPHALRHSFATHHLSGGSSLEEIKTMLGHTSYNTTLIYAEIPTEKLKERVNAITGSKIPFWKKIIHFLIPQPKAKLINLNFTENYFSIGRVDELKYLSANAEKGVNTLILGKIGVGKSHLLENIQTEKKILRIDDSESIKKTLTSILLMLYKSKESVLKVLWKDFTNEEINKKIQRENITSICETIKASVKPREYILIIDDLTSITPTAKKAIEKLKDTFIIIAAAREIKANNSSFLWNFERLDLKVLNRRFSMQLINQLSHGLEVENKEIFLNHIFDQTNGNPRAITELINRYKKEPFLDLQTIKEIKHTGALPEFDMTWLIIVFLGVLTTMRYLARDLDEPALRFIGSIAMVVLIMFRPMMRSLKRTFI